MRSKTFQRLLDKVPKETKIFVRMYGDIVVRVNRLIKEKGYSQKELAEKLNKRPSEISKWLNGEHNFTLRSIAKLEVELGEPILRVPKREEFEPVKNLNNRFMIQPQNNKRNLSLGYAAFEKEEDKFQSKNYSYVS